MSLLDWLFDERDARIHAWAYSRGRANALESAAQQAKGRHYDLFATALWEQSRRAREEQARIARGEKP